MGCVLSGSPASGFVRRLSRKDPRFERRREDRLRQLPQFPGVSRRTLRQGADLLLRDGFESVDVELRFRRRYLLQPDLSRFVRADPGRLHVDLQQPRPQSLHGYGQRQRFALARRTVASGVAQYPPLQRGARKLRSAGRCHRPGAEAAAGTDLFLPGVEPFRSGPVLGRNPLREGAAGRRRQSETVAPFVQGDADERG